MGTWIAEHALATLLAIIGTFIASFIAKKAGAIMDAIEAKFNIDIDDKLEQRIQDIIRKVVMAISQTYVAGLKKSGKFDGEAKEAALKEAISKSGEFIFDELGIVKNEDELALAVEAEIGEIREIKDVLGGSNGPQGFAKKRKKKKNT